MRDAIPESLRVLGNIAELIGAGNGVFTFHYLGPIKHQTGITAWAKKLINEEYLQLEEPYEALPPEGFRPPTEYVYVPTDYTEDFLQTTPAHETDLYEEVPDDGVIEKEVPRVEVLMLTNRVRDPTDY